jgi:putative two-component system response regulator
MSLADTYDALVSHRIYKNSWSHQEALDHIIANKNIRFDPFIVEAFVLDQKEFIRIAREFSDD